MPRNRLYRPSAGPDLDALIARLKELGVKGASSARRWKLETILAKIEAAEKAAAE